MFDDGLPVETGSSVPEASSQTGELRVAIAHRRGPVTLDVTLTLSSAWTAIFGPSGAGKSSLLRIVAGLDWPEEGRVEWRGEGRDGVLLTDTATGTLVPVHRRMIRLVAQRPALFPQMSVLGNVRYGVKKTFGEGPSVEEVVRLCRISHLLAKRPAELSGGERQRVALARMLAPPEGRLLLLDEPFTGLEAILRNQILRDLRVWTAQRRMMVVLVTHDLGEVLESGAEVVRMEAGRVLAQGEARKVLAAEQRMMLRVLGGLE